MSDILNKNIVLVLNRNWQAINIRAPQEAFCQMATNVATALDIQGEDYIRPVQWDEWITLPIRPQDNAVRTAHSVIRVPTVIVAVNFAKVPKKRPKLCARNIRERDGNRCQYTGKLLKPDEGSLDHVVPRSRGGPDTWDSQPSVCSWSRSSSWLNASSTVMNRTPSRAALLRALASVEICLVEVDSFRGGREGNDFVVVYKPVYPVQFGLHEFGDYILIDYNHWDNIHEMMHNRSPLVTIHGSEIVVHNLLDKERKNVFLYVEQGNEAIWPQRSVQHSNEVDVHIPSCSK